MEPSKQEKMMNIIDQEQVMDAYSEENILVEILNRLPVRSLLRFKCISKFWGTLIDEESHSGQEGQKFPKIFVLHIVC
ncbi:hypothetical protein RDI58_024231 [Solanum bulbocastanum]|uniref:F-box domain-containing protein n=1 Tax=Solanum bulbocastanum TaxID=147425 RepID=A0AAN8T0N8_SOLBU